VIRDSIEINRPAAEVFAYLDQLGRHSEWQRSLLSVKVETEGPTRVGTRVLERRKVPGGARDIPYEVTAHEPPRTASFHGTAGPVRPAGKMTVESLGESSSRLTLELELEGHGLGKLFAVLARRQAAKEVPESHKKLKELLEHGDATAAPS
jgi:uncharacterized membrane protein